MLCNNNKTVDLKMEKTFKDVAEVIADYSGLSRKVLDYCQIVKRIVDTTAKQPGFSADSWAALAELVDVENFQRIGNFKEEMNWQEYLDFLTGWASTSEWECSFKRITEHDNVVFLELEERTRMGEFEGAVNSFSVYEFNSDGKMQHIDVYLQMGLPDPDMLKSYENVL